MSSSGDYVVSRALGVGVFEATHSASGRVVAVKLVDRSLPEVEATRKHLERLVQEASFLCACVAPLG
jgi:hypothetical protein